VKVAESTNYYYAWPVFTGDKVFAHNDQGAGTNISMWNPADPATGTNILGGLPASFADDTVVYGSIYSDGGIWFYGIYNDGTKFNNRLFRYDTAANSFAEKYDGDGEPGFWGGNNYMLPKAPSNKYPIFNLHDKVCLICMDAYDRAYAARGQTGSIWVYNGLATKENGGGGISHVRKKVPKFCEEDFWDMSHMFKTIFEAVNDTDSSANSFVAQIGFGYLPMENKRNLVANTGKYAGFKIVLDDTNLIARGIYGAVGDGSIEKTIKLNHTMTVNSKTELEIDYDPDGQSIQFLIDEEVKGSINNFHPTGDAVTTNSWLININARSWGNTTSLDLLQLKHYIA